LQLPLSRQNGENEIILPLFNPQRYEFPVPVTTFANGSGRIDAKQLLRINKIDNFIIFCPFQ
jgi:hypothetical protein